MYLYVCVSLLERLCHSAAVLSLFTTSFYQTFLRVVLAFAAEASPHGYASHLIYFFAHYIFNLSLRPNPLTLSGECNVLVKTCRGGAGIHEPCGR